MDTFNIPAILTLIFIGLVSFLPGANSEALKLTSENYDQTLKDNKLVLINFFADWCIFSQRLAPIFHQAADVIHKDYPNVKLGRVDCEQESELSSANNINKFPTIKLFRNGKVVRKEYRGQRSVDAFSKYIKEQIKPAVVTIVDAKDLRFDETKNTFAGFFHSAESEAYKIFCQACEEMFEKIDCIALVGGQMKVESALMKPKKGSGENDVPYPGGLLNIDSMRSWLNEMANPLLREITFENAEELTEDGIPFLILFHKPGDVESAKIFKKAIESEIPDQRESVKCLTADGTKFAHPLRHMGKTTNDLPVIAIDSFKHMYLFKKFSNLEVRGKLRQFIQDLHSGKLHHDFHNPPPEEEEEPVQEIPKLDEVKPPVEKKKVEVVADGVIREPVPQDKSINQKDPEVPASVNPPETIFKKLAPSDSRYTFLNERDEL